MPDWAQVKYLEEDQRAEVKTLFFKVVVDGLVKPEDLEVGNTYSVFWSSDPEETPQDIMEQGNPVLDIDGLSELERRRRKKDGPLKGYYNAILLSLKEEEDIERPYKRELSGSNCLPENTKRTKVPSAKALEAKRNFEVVKRKSTKPIIEPNGGNKKVMLPKASIVECTKRNLTTVFSQISNQRRSKTKSKKREKPGLDTQDPDYDPGCSDEEKGSQENSAKFWEKKFKDLKRQQMAERSQREETDFGKTQTKTVPRSTNKLSHPTIKKPNEKPIKQALSRESPLHEEFDTDGYNEFSSRIDNAFPSPASLGFENRHSTMRKDIQGFNTAFDQKTLHTPNKAANSEADNDGNEDFGEGQGGDDDSLNSTVPLDDRNNNSDSESSEDELEIVPRTLKPPVRGAAGDSAALFAFCNKLWKPEELVVRSPTGLPPPSKKGAASYPRMTPKKVDQCKAFLRKRILNENPKTSEEEMQLRLHKVGYILGQKVSSTRRSFRNKKISFPSAEEVREQKKKKKEERRLRRQNENI